MQCQNIIVLLCMVSLGENGGIVKSGNPVSNNHSDDVSRKIASSESIDERFDKLVQRVFKDKRLNPLTLHKDYVRHINEPINERIGLVRVRGHIKIAHARLRGLASIGRTGHCKVETTKEGNKLLKVLLQTTDGMVLEADVSGKLIGIPSLTAKPIEVHIRRMVAEVVIERNSATGLFKLKKFHIPDIPKVQIRLQGSIHVPLVGSIFDLITNSALHFFNKKIKHVINRLVKSILFEELKNPLYFSILMPTK